MTVEPRLLPPRRPSKTIDFELFDGYTCQNYSAQYSEFVDGTLAEVFLVPVGGRNAKVGGPLDTIAKDLSVLFSIARRFGAPVDVVLGALSQEKDGAMLGPLGEFLRLHAAEMPILPPAPAPDFGQETPAPDGGPSGGGAGGAAVARDAVVPPSSLPAAVAPPDGASGEGDGSRADPRAVVVLSVADASGAAGAFKRGVPA